MAVSHIFSIILHQKYEAGAGQTLTPRLSLLKITVMLINKWLNTLGRYLILMGRTFQRPERMRMFMKEYVKEMAQLGVNSIGIVLLISFFIGAVICIQMKLNIQSPWMPRWVTGYTTREIMLLEF